jgi:hypothetical protein
MNKRYRTNFDKYLSIYNLGYAKFSILISLRDKLNHDFHHKQGKEIIRDLSLDFLEIPDLIGETFRPYYDVYEQLTEEGLIYHRRL